MKNKLPWMQTCLTRMFFKCRKGALAALMLVLSGAAGLAQATLPVSRTAWATEPTGWANSGCSQRTTSFACSGNDATTFDTGGDFRTVNFSGTPNQLVFGLKKSSMSGESKLVVEESANGTTYSTIGTYGTATGATAITDCGSITLSLASTTRFVRWTYTKATGNCDMDDVSISASVTGASKMIAVLPNQTFTSGSAVTGTPSDQTAGSAFNVDVYAVNTDGITVDTTYTGNHNVTFTGPTTGTFSPSTATAATFTSGKATISVTLNKAAATTLTASDGSLTGGASSSVNVNAASVSKLQILLPGETAAAGTATGKTGTPTAQIAGTAISTIIVNAVDANWNKVTTSTPNVTITSSDANATVADDNGGTAGNVTLVLGTATLSSFTFKTAGSATITATDASATLTANTSASVTVGVGAVTKLQILLPGETAAPGTATGKTGAPTAQTAGTAITTIIVNAVDANWNKVTASTPNVTITSSDANATIANDNGATAGNITLVAGTRTLSSFTFKTAGAPTITATDAAATLTANTSASVTVSAGVVAKLQLLLPGETAAPGTSTGKTGTPTGQTAGTAISTIVVNAVDANWNVVASSTPNVTITSTDANAAIADDNGGTAGNVSLTSGTTTLSSFTFKTAGSRTITATDAASALTANTSPSVTVTAGSFTKLQLLVPGETAAPGTTTGKTGAPTTQNILGAFNVTVNAVDANWNKVTSAPTDAIALSSSDGAFTSPGGTLASGAATISATFGTTGGQTITATDSTDGSKSSDTSPSITVQAVLMKVTLPGETFTGGSGNTGTPDAQTAGTAFNITLTAVDNANVVDTSYTGSKTITFTGPGGSPTYPANVTFASGQGTASITLTKAETITITAMDGTRSGIASSSLSVSAGSVSKLQILLPGETAAPGTTTGKTGSPSGQTAGAAISIGIIVNAVDANWNKITASTPDVVITSSDANAVIADDNGGTAGNVTLVAGTATLSSFTFKTAATQTITATDAATTYTANTSANVTVSAGTVTKLQVLMPGESAAPGTATGKTGSPTTQTRAASLTITVRSVDANWNVVSSTHIVAITSSDSTASLPGNAALASGTKTFSVTFNTANTTTGWTVTATDTDVSPFSPNTGSATLVNPNPYFKSRATGNWSDFNTWSIATDGINFINATTGQTPTGANSDSIQITGGFNVTVSAPVSIDQTTVDAGSTITVSSSQTLTVLDGTGTDLDVSGTVVSAGTITPTGTIVFESGGKYQHNTSASGVVPASTWNTGSTCEIIGSPSGNPGGLGQSFYNFTWNASGQSANINLVGALATINGDFTVQNTAPTFELRLVGGATLNMTIGGNLIISGGKLVGSASSSSIWNCTIAGNLNVASGTLDLGSASGSTTLNVSGNVSVASGGTLTKTTTSRTGAINFSKSGIQTYANAGTLGGSIAWTVNSGSTLDVGSSIISGTSSTFTLSSGAGIKIANTTGLAGSITVTGTKIFSSGADYTYNGSASQTIGVVTYSTANTVNNLTIANNAGAVSLGANLTVSGTLAVSANARLDFNSFTISTPSASLGGTLTMEVNKTGPNAFTGSKLTQSSGTLTYGGALTVTASGTALASGDSLPLFAAGAFDSSGWFSLVSLPSLSSGLSWDTNKLATQGILDVYSFTTNAIQTMVARKDTATTLLKSKLTSKTSGARGTVSVLSVSSANGATVGISGNDITYLPPSGITGIDSFNAVLSDGHGSITATVVVTVNAVNAGPSLDGVDVGGHYKITTSGMPNQIYNVQAITDGNGVWQTISTATAADNGVVIWTDQDLISAHTSRVYRLAQP